jgi:hypothetical protein
MAQLRRSEFLRPTFGGQGSSSLHMWRRGVNSDISYHMRWICWVIVAQLLVGLFVLDGGDGFVRFPGIQVLMSIPVAVHIKVMKRFLL